MSRVGHTLSLAPATVDRAEEAAREQRNARRREHRAAWIASGRPEGIPGPVTVLSMEAEVWATALSIARGDVARIERVSPTEVIVHNHPRER